MTMAMTAPFRKCGDGRPGCSCRLRRKGDGARLLSPLCPPRSPVGYGEGERARGPEREPAVPSLASSVTW